MKLYIICPVRNASVDSTAIVEQHVREMEADGHTVYYPPRDADQTDASSLICHSHAKAMRGADMVHVFWDASSSGSHFDFGMAYALGKPIAHVRHLSADGPDKSYAKVLEDYSRRAFIIRPTRGAA